MFRLAKPVGDIGRNLQPDTAKVQGVLERAGFKDHTRTEGPTGLYSFLTEESIRAAQKAAGLQVDGLIRPGGETIRMLRAKVGPRPAAPSKREEGVQTARHFLTPPRLPGRLPGGITPPLPPILKGRPPQKLDFERQTEPLPPPKPMLGTTLPVIDVKVPSIFIFPDISDEINKINIDEVRRERPETKQEIDFIRDYFIDRHGWKHEAGGRKEETGEEKSEQAIPGPGRVFPHPVTGKPGDGRPGSVFPDLIMKDQNGKFIYIQHVDIDKNGKPTDRELEAAERIRRATNGTVYLIPKLWQLRRLRNRLRRGR